MIIGIGAGAVFVTALTIHVIRTFKWTIRTKKESDVFRKQNNFKISGNYDDHDITLSKALSSFGTKNTELEENQYL